MQRECLGFFPGLLRIALILAALKENLPQLLFLPHSPQGSQRPSQAKSRSDPPSCPSAGRQAGRAALPSPLLGTAAGAKGGASYYPQQPRCPPPSPGPVSPLPTRCPAFLPFADIPQPSTWSPSQTADQGTLSLGAEAEPPLGTILAEPCGQMSNDHQQPPARLLGGHLPSVSIRTPNPKQETLHWLRPAGLPTGRCEAHTGQRDVLTTPERCSRRNPGCGKLTAPSSQSLQPTGPRGRAGRAAESGTGDSGCLGWGEGKAE